MKRALHLLTEALALLEDTQTVERVYVLNDLGRLHLRHGDWEQASALCVQSLAISARRDDCAEEALSLVMLGWVAIHSGQIATGSSRLELARALLSEQPLPVDRAAEVYHTGIRALEAAREHHRARAWVDAALAYARAHGAHADLAIYRAYHAATQRRAGEWDSAIGVAMEAVAALRATRRAELREGLRILGDLQRGRGELDAARASYDEALALGESDAAIGRALLAMAQEQWHDAAERLAAARTAHPSSDVLFTLRVLPLLVEARARAGELDAAHSDLRHLRELLAASDYRAGYAALAQSAGVLHSVAGDAAAAARDLREAVRAWGELELPYETARATLLLATELVTSNNEAYGVQLAAEAASAFEDLGATLEVGRAHAVLRRGGVRTRRRQLNHAPALPQPLDRLTSREAQVLFELARGCTNKQIARTLSMSPRTVGNHVSAIFAKLGCATRTEAAQLVVAVRATSAYSYG
jgi:ATP/maltotriose-dependent transcriptional regulator MalT